MNLQHYRVMTLVQEKKGGPYSKDERVKRQKEVFRFHFEFGYPATRIADLMKINRNTINADIKYWYSSFKEDLKQNSDNFTLRQIGRLEAQRTRIMKNITENKNNDVKYEKLLLNIETEINNMLPKAYSNQQMELKQVKIQEDEIKDIILFLLIKHNKNYSLKKEDMISEIMNLQQCTLIQAETIFSQIQELGLECTRKVKSSEFAYDLLEFAFLRRYISPNDEFIVQINALYMLNIEYEGEIIKQNEEFSEKYGDKGEWSNEIFVKYDEIKKQKTEKYVKITSEVIADALESLSNQEQIRNYLKYISVFFGEKAKNRFE